MSNPIQNLNHNRKISKRRRWTFGSRKCWPPYIHPKAKEIAHFRLAILRAWDHDLSKIKKPKTKVQATMDFLQFLNSGLFLPEGIVFKLKHVGRTTLYNWNKARREGGLRALVPRYKWKPGSGAVLVPINLTSTLKKIRIAGIPKRRARYDILPCIRHQWKGRPLECPIQIAIYYSMPIRKGTKMGRRIRMVNRRISHIGNPYLDALNAFIMDCLVGIVFYDHSQIVLFHSEKNYAWWPQTLIVIRPLSG